MLTVSEHPETLEEVQQTIQKWLGHSRHHNIPFTFSRGPSSSGLVCFISHNLGDLKLKTAERWVFFEMKNTCLKLNLDRFLVRTAIEGKKVCLNIEAAPEPEHRFLQWALREIAETKHPAFQSRILRAFINLEEELPSTTIEQATGAPTDLLVALEALSSAPGTSQLINDDPLLAAKMRGLKRKRNMLDVAGGALSSQEVADVLGISRQAVDKRRASNQLLALTQGRRGYSYPRFQFEEGRTIKGLQEVLEQLKSLDPWMQMVFFTSPNERLGGKTPIDSLHRGLVNEVAEAATGYGEQGAL
jgi:hypothetical protein